MGLRMWAVGGLVALGALAGAGGALADTTTVGEAALTPNSGLVITATQNVPVFQGDASGNYVLSSPQTGTITSWSFLSAGDATGEHFVLRVLAPIGAGGTDWQAVATSAPVAVTSATGVDAVNGPFSTSIAITAGDRIALQPVDDGMLPTEAGVNGQDGIRYFSAPIADGSSATIDPGSASDNGQVVPIQATVQYTPATPPALANVTPPVVASGSTPVTSARDGEVLTCLPGSYNLSLTMHAYYWFWTETSYVRKGTRGVLQTETSETGLTVSGQTITLPDLPAFAEHPPPRARSTISCEDNASAGSQVLSVRSAAVRVQPLAPVLATRRIPRGRKKPVTVPIDPPSITKGVGYGGTNRCSPGKWIHFPTGFTYSWWRTTPQNKSTTTKGYHRLHIGQTYKPPPGLEGRRLACFVLAFNDAGAYRLAKSNSYIVPASAPRPTSAPVVTMSTDDPHRDAVAVNAGTHAVLPDYGNSDWAYFTTIAEKVYLSCDTGGWNRGDLTFTRRWFVNGRAIDITGDTIGTDYVSISDPYDLTETIGGSSLRFNFTPDNTQEPTLFNGLVTCTVTATTSRGVKSDSSSLPLRIWNGCDVGIEPWDKKILFNGPLCGDYTPFYNNS